MYVTDWETLQKPLVSPIVTSGAKVMAEVFFDMSGSPKSIDPACGSETKGIVNATSSRGIRLLEDSVCVQ